MVGTPFQFLRAPLLTAGLCRMDSSDVTKKKLARFYAAIQNTPARGQVPNNPPLTPGQISIIHSQYPKSEFANTNNLYPCGTSTLCSTVYAPREYYNATN
jgi:hypothetical protein